MRTSWVISLVLLVLTVAAGCYEETETRQLSERYVSASQELKIMAEIQAWPRAQETIDAYKASWQQIVPWLQILINHDDIDDVTLSLERIQATIEAQDLASCIEACAELKENARHIFHRDAFTLGNVL